MNNKRISLLSIVVVVFAFNAIAQSVAVDVNINVKHTVGGVSEFDRSKFITFHGDIDDKEWDEDENFTSDLRDDFLNGYDVYLGRNTGGVQWALRNTQEDPSKPGFPNITELASRGASNRSSYSELTQVHPYEHRNVNQILCMQDSPFYPDGSQVHRLEESHKWAFSQTDTDTEPLGTASGVFYANYIKDYFGGNGEPRPHIIEVVNEPLWNQVKFGDATYAEIFKFHNSVATEVKKVNDDVLVGGYVAAFPDFEKNNFQDWVNIDKLFMDMCGETMDFWSIHLYDFASIGGGKKKIRSGSNIEATFDMMEQYSKILLDTVKPFVISEYGSRAHDLEGKPWSSYRDWLCVKGISAQLMSFLERPHLMVTTLPFVMGKTKWYGSLPEDSHEHRLFRMSGEPNSATGEWVYTDFVKFYQLWLDVKGTRVDSWTNHADIQVNAYVDGKKAYVIVNNLLFTDKNISLTLFDDHDNTIESISVKHLYEKYNKTNLNETVYTNPDELIELGAEATMVVEYTFKNNIVIDQDNNESKYYADTYFKPISLGNTESFNINGVELGSQGEAILRLGIGREHGKSLHPTVKVNGTAVTVPSNFRGYNQLERDSYYGVIEIPVSYSLLQENNKVDVSFSDAGGHLASVTMQVFSFSKEIQRTQEGRSFVQKNSVLDDIVISPNPANAYINIFLPEQVYNSELSIRGLDGREYINTKLTGIETMVSLESLPQGVYAVSVTNSLGWYNSTIMKR